MNNLIHDNWYCRECDESFEHSQLKDHLVKHNINAIEGKRSMISHLDAKDWFEWNYKWEIGGLELVQSIREKRTKEDKLWWR